MIVAIVGLLVVVFGAYEAYKGLKQKFNGTLRQSEMSPPYRRVGPAIGTTS